MGNMEAYIFLDEKEISDILHFISQKYPQMFGMVFLAIYLGLRRSEILGLKISAIDFSKHTVSVKHTITRVKQTSARDRTKSKKSYRTLSLFPTAEALLKRVIEEKESNKRIFCIR